MKDFKEPLEELRNESQNLLDQEKIFPGHSWQTTAFSSKFGEICVNLGLKNLTVHSLRHTFSTRADKFGVGVFAQKSLLGHSKISMTDRYTHLSRETLKENLLKFENYIVKK